MDTAVVDHLDPDLPSAVFAQGLHSADPTRQEPWARRRRLVREMICSSAEELRKIRIVAESIVPVR